MGIVATALVVVSSPASAATVRYVDRAATNCSDSGPGSVTQPYCTIVRAASSATPGDTVEVRAGTYTGTITVANSGTQTAPITFHPAPGAIVTVTAPSGLGFSVKGKNWITIDGFRIAGTGSHGIGVTGTGIVIRNNDVSNAGVRTSGKTARGINLDGCTGCIVADNVVHDNSDHGIFLTGGTTATTILHNEVFGNARGYARAAAGISATNASNNTYDGNIAHDNEDTGIQVRTAANNFLVVNNISYDNGDHGYDTLSATGTRYISNVAFGNYKDGFSIESSSTGSTVRNNIGVNNGLTTGEYDLWVSDNSQAGFSSDYNIFWNSTSQTPIKWGSTRYASVAAFRDATPNEDHGIGADPKFVAPGSGDFHLMAGSPAIDSADSGVSGERPVDAEGNARTDDAGTPNTGVGPRTYDDRGALEYQGTSSGGNHPPVANPDPATVARNSTNNLIAVLANDTDPDGDTLTLSSVGAPSHGTTSISGSSASYTPTSGYSGPDSFTYVVSDGHGGTATGTVSVTVTAGNSNPVANPDSATVAPGSSNNLIAVLANDTDPDGDALSLTSVSSPSHGAAAISSGKVSYSPARGYAGPDSFTYVVSDGHGGTATGTVTVTVGSGTTTNRPPVANPDSATVLSGSSNNLIAVLANDTDPDGDALSLTSVSSPPHGTATISSGKVSYTPAAGYSGPDSFTYVISDGRGGTATGTVSLTVQSIRR